MRALCILGDGKFVKGRGLCGAHYKAWRDGRIEVAGSKRRTSTFDEKVAKYVDMSGDCWIWTGARMGVGYGNTELNGVQMTAHKMMYTQLVGPVPKGMDLDHQCHNEDPVCKGGSSCKHRLCCNPDHLVLVTRKENLNRGNGAGGKKWKEAKA